MTPIARVALLTDAAMDRHASPGHPERPARRAAAAVGVEDGARRAGATLERVVPLPADGTVITLTHDPGYVEALDAAEASGGGWLDADTYVVLGSMHAARLAAGATVQAARAAVTGEATVAFAAVRPPGHHASAGQGRGFCLFNNVAVAVGALRENDLAERIAIVDWDVHHGDGTQAIFERDPQLCYASTHGWPLYPGTGAREERGSGPAVGTKHNRPLPAGAGDEAFTATWIGDLLPAVAAFGPEAILVSAGYDAHRADPLAHLEVTEAGYAAVASALGDVARSAGLRGVALTLEGGYDTDAMRASVAATIHGLLTALAGEPHE